MIARRATYRPAFTYRHHDPFIRVVLMVVVALVASAAHSVAHFAPAQDSAGALERNEIRRTTLLIPGREAPATGDRESFLYGPAAPPSPVERFPVDGETTEGEFVTTDDSYPLREPSDAAADRSLERQLNEWLREEDLLDESLSIDPYWYRGAGHHPSNGWLIGQGNSMGIFSLSSCQQYDFTDRSIDVAVDWAVNWIMGPRQTDMPPRVYDLLVRLGYRGKVTERLGYDLSFSFGVYSDFEGSAREGLRWPSTAVAYFQATDRLQWLAGVDILDRDDWFCLPIAGAVWTPHPDLRFDFVFPKPRVLFAVPKFGWMYFGGELWGNSWAIERSTGFDDVATYRDVRAVIGLHGRSGERMSWFSQLGVAFDRRLEYRSSPDIFSPRSLVLLNLNVSY